MWVSFCVFCLLVYNSSFFDIFAIFQDSQQSQIFKKLALGRSRRDAETGKKKKNVWSYKVQQSLEEWQIIDFLKGFVLDSPLPKFL